MQAAQLPILILAVSAQADIRGLVLDAAAGGDAARFAGESLFAPLGIEDYRWGRQPNGMPEGAARMFLRPRDMARLGQLFLKGGLWQGKQVVPSDWVAASTRLHVSARPLNPNDYGYFCWLRKLVTPRGNAVEYFGAEGDGGQYIAVFPARDLVVVATGGNYGDYGTYDSQLARMLALHVLPSLGL